MCNKISNIIPKYLIINYLHTFSNMDIYKALNIKQLKIIFVFSQKKLLKYFVVSNIVYTFATSNNKNSVSSCTTQSNSGYSVKRFSVIRHIMLNNKPQT